MKVRKFVALVAVAASLFGAGSAVIVSVTDSATPSVFSGVKPHAGRFTVVS